MGQRPDPLRQRRRLIKKVPITKRPKGSSPLSHQSVPVPVCAEMPGAGVQISYERFDSLCVH